MSSNSTNCTEFDVVVTANPSFTNRPELLVVSAVALSVLAVFTLFLNAIVITAVCLSVLRGRGSARAQQSGGNTRVVKLLMTSMAVADAAVSLVIMPVRISEIVLNGAWALPIDYCKFSATVSVYFCTVSIYHVMCMAIDRYLAVCKPLTHRLLTVRAGGIMAGLCWVIPLFFYPLPVLSEWVRFTKTASGCVPVNHSCRDGQYELFSVCAAVVSFYFPFSVISLLYFRVLITVQNFQKGLKSINTKDRIQITNITKSFQDLDGHQKEEETVGKRTSIQPTAFDKVSTSISNNKVDKKTFTSNGIVSTKKSVRKRNSKKALLSIGLIVIGFTASWLPYAVFMEIFASNINRMFPTWLMTLTAWLGYFNSTLNPILFCFHRGIRADVKKLLCRP